jgi:hypothetical protein
VRRPRRQARPRRIRSTRAASAGPSRASSPPCLLQAPAMAPSAVPPERSDRPASGRVAVRPARLGMRRARRGGGGREGGRQRACTPNVHVPMSVSPDATSISRRSCRGGGRRSGVTHTTVWARLYFGRGMGLIHTTVWARLYFGRGIKSISGADSGARGTCLTESTGSEKVSDHTGFAERFCARVAWRRENVKQLREREDVRSLTTLT